MKTHTHTEHDSNKRSLLPWASGVVAALALTVSIPLQADPSQDSTHKDSEVKERQYSMEANHEMPKAETDRRNASSGDAQERRASDDTFAGSDQDPQVSSSAQQDAPKVSTNEEGQTGESDRDYSARIDDERQSRQVSDRSGSANEQRQYSARGDQRGAEADVNRSAGTDNADVSANESESESSSAKDLKEWEGKSVYSSDGTKVGEVEQLVLNFDEGKASHVLIDNDGLFSGSRLVQIGSLSEDARNDDRLQLDMRAEDYEASANYESSREISENVRSSSSGATFAASARNAAATSDSESLESDRNSRAGQDSEWQASASADRENRELNAVGTSRASADDGYIASETDAVGTVPDASDDAYAAGDARSARGAQNDSNVAGDSAGDRTMSGSERFDRDSSSDPRYAEAARTGQRDSGQKQQSNTHAFHTDVIGMEVNSNMGEEIGEIEKLIRDDSDRVFAIVGDLEDGIELPNGAKKLAIRLDALRFSSDDDELDADLGLSDLESAPEARADGSNWQGLGENRIVIIAEDSGVAALN